MRTLAILLILALFAAALPALADDPPPPGYPAPVQEPAPGYPAPGLLSVNLTALDSAESSAPLVLLLGVLILALIVWRIVRQGRGLP